MDYRKEVDLLLRQIIFRSGVTEEEYQDECKNLLEDINITFEELEKGFKEIADKGEM